MRRLLENLALLAGSTLVTLLLAEAGLRALHFYPRELKASRVVGSVFIPNARYRQLFEGYSEGRINAAGWRDRDYAENRLRGTTRILFCGDSFVEALQVPLDSTFHKRLERTLNDRARPGHHYEVIALGLSGSGTTREYVMYRTWGVRYDPDVVAVLFYLNDPADNWLRSPGHAMEPAFVEEGDSLRLDTSFVSTPAFERYQRFSVLPPHSSLLTWTWRTWKALELRFSPLAAGTEIGGRLSGYNSWNFHDPPATDSIPAFRLTERILRCFADQVRRDGRRFVLVAAGGFEQEDCEYLAEARKDSTFDPDKIPKWLTAVGRRGGFEVVPLTPAFRAASAGGSPFPWCGNRVTPGHWNERGHALVADVLVNYFAAHPPDRLATAPPPPAPVGPERASRSRHRGPSAPESRP